MPSPLTSRKRITRLPDSKLPGQRRVVIDRVIPEIDAGLFPVKRVVGDQMVVQADAFVDGHDALRVELLYRDAFVDEWQSVDMEFLGNDRWEGSFPLESLGASVYTVRAWLDPYLTWVRDLEKRIEAGQDIELQLQIGAELLLECAGRSRDAGDRATLAAAAEHLDSGALPDVRATVAMDHSLVTLAGRYPPPEQIVTWPRTLEVAIDRERAAFSSWYEVFPRSTSTIPGQHGTFADLQTHLSYIAGMGFDVVYLPPIHPVGETKRKGRNNRVVAEGGEPGSPWAIGSADGGHKAVNPELGTLDDFRSVVGRAQELGMEIALDIAFQCSPDHPYVRDHPEWFRARPDGTIQYAENPPKKYEDIYPFDFETEQWRELWAELRSVFEFWVEQGVRIFRVDNPHTKAFAFWEWCITTLRRKHPDLIFLAEAFTRPKVMYRLAKLGFNQSYTYFAWRNERWDLSEYFTELTQTEVREYFRPNLWPNTPDILTEYLQTGGRPAFMVRMVLAATLGANYGIYGPAFELGEHVPREPGSEEYLDSEKYEIRDWNLNDSESLAPFIGHVNRIRHENPALHRDHRLQLHRTDNEQIIAYSKSTGDFGNVIISVVNLDPRYRQAGWVTLDLEALGLTPDTPYDVYDLLTHARYTWSGARNYVELDPSGQPAHIFRIEHPRGPDRAAPTTSPEGPRAT